jgi:hypothetical protein
MTNLQLTKECANLRLVSHGADVGSGLELYAPTGGCTSFSGHSKVKIGRRKPATIGLGAHHVQGCSEERTPTQNEVLRRGGGNHLDAVRGAVPYTGP